MSNAKLPVLTEGTNSYVSKANAETYFGNRLNNAAWLALSAQDQFRALITASLQISRSVVTASKLPVTTPADTTLQDATCELALSMAADLNVITNATTSTNIKSVKAGSAEVEFFKSGSGSNTGTRFPVIVMDLLQSGSYIEGARISVPVVSGAGCASEFDNADIYSRTRSFS